ncbi:hypothetical protein ACH518_06785 [Methylomonas sp. HW2-6]|uniref:hypothetical protein n=1 Tax=Methylomonas sp. HW2-6 TaxID=3376687 RepID=UPI0040417F5E
MKIGLFSLLVCLPAMASANDLTAVEVDYNGLPGLGGSNAQLSRCGISLNIPAGYVPVRHYNSFECRDYGSGINTTLYDLPRDRLSVCGILGVGTPPWVPVAYEINSSCYKDTTNAGDTTATLIRLPSNNMTICGLVSPPGYDESAKTYDPSCNVNGISQNPNAIVIQEQNATLPPPPPPPVTPPSKSDWVRVFPVDRSELIKDGK